MAPTPRTAKIQIESVLFDYPSIGIRVLRRLIIRAHSFCYSKPGRRSMLLTRSHRGLSETPLSPQIPAAERHVRNTLAHPAGHVQVAR
jgi:hypothetical protein